MTITFTTDEDLDDRYEVIVFTATSPVTSIIAQYVDEQGPCEGVFDGTDGSNANGSFRWLFRNSTRVGNTWTIRREGGWPAPVDLRIKEASGGGVEVPSGLTPTLYSPLVQWSLQGAPDTARMWLDRSGNARNLTSGTGTPVPDLIPGQTAVELPNFGATIPALALNGAMTLTMRVKPKDFGAYQALLDFGNSGSTSNYYLARNAAGKFDYAVSNVAGFSSNLDIPDDAWSFLSLRRSSPNDVILGVNANYQSASGVSSGTGSAGVVILGRVEGGATWWHGAMADVSVWGTCLTDEQLATLRVTVMGS